MTNAAGASRAGGPWTAGLEPPGFVGTHLPTGAPGLPVHEPAVVVARDLRARRSTPPAPAPRRPRRYRIHTRERKRRNRPQPLPQQTRRISLLRLRTDCSFLAQRESAIGRRDLKAHPRTVEYRGGSRAGLAVDDGFPSSSPIPGIRVTPRRWRKRRKRSEDRGEVLAGPHHASKHKRSSVGGVAEMLAVGAEAPYRALLASGQRRHDWCAPGASTSTPARRLPLWAGRLQVTWSQLAIPRNPHAAQTGASRISPKYAR
jgi:hypothetical protein